MYFINKLTREDFVEFLKTINYVLLDVPCNIYDCRHDDKKEGFVILKCSPVEMASVNKAFAIMNSGESHMDELILPTLGGGSTKYKYVDHSMMIEDFSATEVFNDRKSYDKEFYDFMCKKFPKIYAKAYAKHYKKQNKFKKYDSIFDKKRKRIEDEKIK